MFVEYLQDAHEIYEIAETAARTKNNREARRYYRAAVFYASSAIEAFVNYMADSFAKAESLTPHETAFLNDRASNFSPEKISC